MILGAITSTISGTNVAFGPPARAVPNATTFQCVMVSAQNLERIGRRNADSQIARGVQNAIP